MDLSDLRIFRAVVDEGGITRAAARLNRVQSNVTTRIRQLEDDLGVALFERVGKRLHLAPAGRTLVGYADRLLALADEARTAVQDPVPRGVFRLGSMESTAAVRLPEPLGRFQNAYPDVEIELKTGNPQILSAALQAGEIDAAFVAEPVAEGPFDKVPAFRETLVLVSDRDRLDDPADPPPAMIAFEHGCPHRKRLEDWFEKRAIVPPRTVELASYHAMLGCVAVGMGVALVPRSVLSAVPADDRLRVHAMPPGDDVLATAMIWRKGADTPSIRALRAVVAPSP